MIRNLKHLALAALAALAVTASAASASNFTAAEYPVALSGSQKGTHKFTAGGTVTCTTATFAAAASSASESLTIRPTYSGCTALGFVNWSVTGFSEGGCDYLVHTNGRTDLVCQSGEVVVDAGPCTIRIPAQTDLTSNVYHNIEAGGLTQLEMTTNVSGIKYTMVKNNFLCPETAGTFTNGKYEGVTTLEGENNEGEAINIDIG